MTQFMSGCIRLIFGFDHAECNLPAVEWFNIEGFSSDDLNFLAEFVRSILKD